MWWWWLACAGEAPEATTPDEVDPRADVRFDELALAVAHNAMASEADGFLIPNQHLAYEEQLDLGVRGFMLDVHDDDGVPSLCHSSCDRGAQPLEEGFGRFATWLEANPGEVLVFVVQDEIAPGPIVAAAEATGLDRWAIPPFEGAIPTHGELVAADTRLLFTTEGAHEGVPAWFQHTYESLAWDNDYAAREVGDFDCDVLRGDAGNPFFLLNHFLTNPVATPELAEEANPLEVVLAHVDACEASTGDLVSWVAVDFVDLGGVMEAVDALNARRR